MDAGALVAAKSPGEASGSLGRVLLLFLGSVDAATAAPLAPQPVMDRARCRGRSASRLDSKRSRRRRARIVSGGVVGGRQPRSMRAGCDRDLRTLRGRCLCGQILVLWVGIPTGSVTQYEHSPPLVR